MIHARNLTLRAIGRAGEVPDRQASGRSWCGPIMWDAGQPDTTSLTNGGTRSGSERVQSHVDFGEGPGRAKTRFVRRMMRQMGNPQDQAA